MAKRRIILPEDKLRKRTQEPAPGAAPPAIDATPEPQPATKSASPVRLRYSDHRPYQITLPELDAFEDDEALEAMVYDTLIRQNERMMTEDDYSIRAATLLEIQERRRLRDTERRKPTDYRNEAPPRRNIDIDDYAEKKTIGMLVLFCIIASGLALAYIGW